MIVKLGERIMIHPVRMASSVRGVFLRNSLLFSTCTSSATHLYLKLLDKVVLHGNNFSCGVWRCNSISIPVTIRVFLNLNRFSFRPRVIKAISSRSIPTRPLQLLSLYHSSSSSLASKCPLSISSKMWARRS